MSGKILLIVDDSRILHNIKEILLTHDFQTFSFSTAKNALTFVSQNPIAVAIVDMQISDMYGPVVLTKLKEISPEIETLALTDYRSIDSSVEAIKDSIYAYILVPINPGVLIRTIENCLEKQELRHNIKESEKKYRMQFKNSLLPTYIWQKEEKNYVLVDYNYSAENSSSENLKEFLLRKANDLYFDRPEILEDLNTCYEKKINIQREINHDFIITKEMKILNVRYSFVPPEFVVVFTQDMTELKRVVEDLRIKDLAIASSINAMLIGDIDGDLDYVNSSFINMLGYDDDKEVLNKSITEFLQMEKKVIEVIEALYEKGIWVGELVGKRKDGTTFDVEVSTNLVRDDYGKAIRMMASFVDISERKLAELAKRELEEKRANFVSMTNHELRTPLTAIRGFIELLEERIDTLDQERRDRCIRIIKRNVLRLQRLIAGVSDLGRIERNLFGLELKDVDLRDFLESATQTYKTFLGNQLEVTYKPFDYSFLIEADTSRLNQVIDNLLSNAIKHTSNDSRKIVVSSEILQGTVRIKFQDNGAGIRPQIQQKIFERFISFPSKFAEGGSGIGLYLSKKIVEKHGGSLNVYSKGEGHGSIFIVDLPLKSFPEKGKIESELRVS